MTLKELKDNMWIEVCEGDMKPKNQKYLNIIQDYGDEEVQKDVCENCGDMDLHLDEQCPLCKRRAHDRMDEI